MWGVNNRGQIYERAVDGISSGWVQITGGDNEECSGKYFSDVSVSNNGYIWVISWENETFRLCSRIGVRQYCGNMISFSLMLSCLWYTLKQMMKKYGLSMLPTISSNVQLMEVENGALFQEK